MCLENAGRRCRKGVPGPMHIPMAQQLNSPQFEPGHLVGNSPSRMLPEIKGPPGQIPEEASRAFDDLGTSGCEGASFPGLWAGWNPSQWVRAGSAASPLRSTANLVPMGPQGFVNRHCPEDDRGHGSLKIGESSGHFDR